uniref:Uncharacterized protein n=1 Tax=Panagrolaimus sp. ES5 TaxID=591445 RepID=A0AC34FNU8_9BILA
MQVAAAKTRNFLHTLDFCERADIKGGKIVANFSIQRNFILPLLLFCVHIFLLIIMVFESRAEYLAECAEADDFDIRTRNFGKYTSKAERIESKKPEFDHTRRLVDNWRNNDMNQRHSKA